MFIAYAQNNLVVSSASNGTLSFTLLTPLQHLVPIIDHFLQIQLQADRVRLMFILHRLKRWLLGLYRDKVRDQVGRVWQATQIHHT